MSDMSKKWFAIPVILLALWGCYTVSFNLVRHSGYYAQHLPHKKGTNPELIFTLKHLYYLEKPNDSSLRYDYDGANTIIVDENYSLYNYKEPEILLFNKESISTYYDFNNQGKFLFKEVIDNTNAIQHSESSKSQEEAMAYVERAIRPILDVQPKPKHNLQWLFNLIYQKKFQ